MRAAGGAYKNVDALIVQLETELRGQTPAAPKRKSHWLRWAAAGFAVLVAIGYVAQQRQQRQHEDPAPLYNRQPAVDPAAAPAYQGEPAPEVENNDFQPVGQWQMVSETNASYGMSIRFFPNGRFEIVSMIGYYRYPASAGSYEYDAANHYLYLSGVNNMGQPFRQTLPITGRHGDHFHVLFNGSQWALKRTA